MSRAAEFAGGQLGEPAFDEVEPGRKGGGEVQVKAGMPEQPLLDRLGLVGGVVVQDQVEFEVLGDGGVDDLQEAEELLVAGGGGSAGR